MSMYVQQGRGLLRAPTGGIYVCSTCPCGPVLCTTKCQIAPPALNCRIRATWGCPSALTFDSGEFVLTKAVVAGEGTEGERCTYETSALVPMIGGSHTIKCRVYIELNGCYENFNYQLSPNIYFYYPLCEEYGESIWMAETFGWAQPNWFEGYRVWDGEPVAISEDMIGYYVGHQGAYCTYWFWAALGCGEYAPPYNVRFELWE